MSNSRALELDGEQLLVRVGHEDAALPRLVEKRKELVDMRPDTDEVLDIRLEGEDVDLQLPRPVVKAVPGQLSLVGPEARHEHGPGGLRVHAPQEAPLLRQVLVPEVVVVIEVEQG